MVFFNPIIRYLLLNSLKLNFTAFIVFKPPLGNAVDILLGLVIMLLINAVPIYFFYILRKNREDLEQDSKKKAFGTLYQGKNIKKEAGHSYMFPLVFFFRRTFFIIATVYLFDYPSIQVILNSVLSFATLVYLVYDKNQYATTSQRVIELCTEALFLSASLFMAQFLDARYSSQTQTAIEDFTLLCISLMLILNFCSMIWTAK